jgi:hypothetical protein
MSSTAWAAALIAHILMGLLIAEMAFRQMRKKELTFTAWSYVIVLLFWELIILALCCRELVRK